MHINPQISLWRVCREHRNAKRDVMGKPEGKRFIGRPRRGQEQKSKIYLKELCRENLEWIKLAQDRQRDFCKSGNELRGSKISGNFCSSLRTITFSSRSVLSGDSLYMLHAYKQYFYGFGAIFPTRYSLHILCCCDVLVTCPTRSVSRHFCVKDFLQSVESRNQNCTLHFTTFVFVPKATVQRNPPPAQN